MLQSGPLAMLSEAKHWKTDIPSGLVVFLVAIPLCLGIALASGSSAMSGIIAGIVGGLIVTLFSNSSLGVSGPAAGLVAIVAPAIVQLGFGNFLLAVVISGVIQFVLGLVKAGTIGYYFPTAVIKGMLAAIGLIIILKQIPHAFGDDKVPEGVINFNQADGQNTYTEIWNSITNPTISAVIITVVCLAILILWEQKFMKQLSFSKIIQGPLVAVIAGILMTLAFSSVESLRLENDHLVRLPVWKLDELPSGSVELDTPMHSGEKRFQSQTIKDGPIVFQSQEGKYYLESGSDKKYLKEIPKESIALDEKTAEGQERFQVRYVQEGPVYYMGEDEKYHLDAPVFIFPHFKPSEITSTKVSLGHGSHGADHGSDHDADLAEAKLKLNLLGEKIGGSSQESAEITKTISDLKGLLNVEAVEESTEEPAEGASTFVAIYLILLTAVTIAIVASLESLLCAEATDKLDPQRRQTDLNQELRAQGIGNIVSGLFGGLPVTQVIVRSSTNIQSGAQSRFAAFVHGIFLIGSVIAIPFVLNLIPLASLAAILFVVGYKLAHPSKFKTMYSQGWTQFLPFIITIVAIIQTDLLIGIGIGLIASLFFIILRSYAQSLWVSTSEEDGKKVHRLTLAERAFFINKGNIQTALQAIKPGERVVIDASNTVHMDQDVLDVFEDFRTHAPYDNIEIEWIGTPGDESNTDPARIQDLANGV